MARVIRLSEVGQRKQTYSAVVRASFTGTAANTTPGFVLLNPVGSGKLFRIKRLFAQGIANGTTTGAISIGTFLTAFATYDLGAGLFETFSPCNLGAQTPSVSVCIRPIGNGGSLLALLPGTSVSVYNRTSFNRFRSNQKKVAVITEDEASAPVLEPGRAFAIGCPTTWAQNGDMRGYAVWEEQ